MAQNPIRTLTRLAKTVRRLCTAAAVEVPLYKRLSSLGRAREGSVKLTMNKWIQEGKSVTAKQIVTYVIQLRKFNRFREALELMEWMDTRGMNMSYGNHALRIGLLSKAKGVNDAENYFNSLPKPTRNEFTYGALLNVYCVENLLDKALALHKKMQELNYGSNTLVYNNILNLFKKNGLHEKVVSLVEEMKAENIPRDSFTYNMLINSYSSQGDIEAVERTLMEMQEDDAEALDWSIYGNVASIYISAELAEKAKSSIKKLEETMSKKDRLAYHFLVSLHARMGDLEEVNRVFQSLKANLKMTNKSFLIILRALRKIDNFDALKNCFEEWESSYQSYDIILANVMIGAYLDHDMIKEAEELRGSAASKGSESDRVTSELFINYHLRKGEMQFALKNFETAVMKLKNWKPDQNMLNAFFRHFEESKDATGAEAFRKVLDNVIALQNSPLATSLTSDQP